jgi:2-furoyl-CoA dehydrogenase large subunit
VADALGVEDLTLPLTPTKLSALIHGEERAPPAGTAVRKPPRQAGAPGHMLQGADETFVPASPAEVWRTLLDPDKLAAVIPGCHKLDRVGENDYRAEVSLGVGPVRGRFTANVKLSDMVEPTSATLSGGLVGPLGASQGEGHVTLTPEGNGTRVRYDYAIALSGTVASVGGRMLEGAARAVVGQFFNRLVAQVGGRGGAPAPAAPAASLWQRILRMLGIG